MRKDTEARRQRALELAAQGLPPSTVAERLGVSDRTVRTYLADPNTAAELRALQDERLRELARRALAACEPALATLLHVAEHGPAGARVAAAKAILEAATRLLEASDLTERVAALEARQDSAEARSGSMGRWRA